MVVTEDVVRDAPQSRDDSRICSNARGIFAECDIARVVGFVLDPPVLADGVGGDICGDRATGQIERDFRRGLPEAGGGLAGVDRALDLDDGGDMRLPFGSHDGGRGVEHRNGAGFVAVAPFLVHGLDARQGSGGGADGLDLLTEDRLVVLDLDD